MRNKIRKLFAIVLCIAMLTSVMSGNSLAAAKTSGKCGKNAKWSFDKSSKTLTISGKGAMKNFKETDEGVVRPWDDIVDERKISLIVENGITEIGDNAFSYTYLKSIKLPKTLKRIGKSAFQNVMEGGMPNSITIPKSVIYIGEYAFLAEDLKSIQVEKGNKQYTSVKGVLFNKSKTTLITCPIEKKGSFSIPSNTKVIEDFAFMGSNLKKVVVPNSVNTVKGSPFMWTNIDDLYFKGAAPKGLVFDEEDTIKTIHYPKSKESSWKKVINKSNKQDFYGSWKTWNP